ncbi:MAG TPA: FAD-dependent monooxygenase [Anseongella sp.]|nr:FAD-dependent monooxygenase [Anseongella sp.]
MKGSPTYDCALVGGGLAGLAAAAELAGKGYRTLLLEKGTYPFHRVCGEYISLESRSFLLQLGLPLESWELPRIKNLALSAPGGALIRQELSPGGLGVSRYRIDECLALRAEELGAEVLDGTKVTEIRYQNDNFVINSNKGTFTARTCCGAFGKRSNLDVKWKRPFLRQTGRNFIGVKYHVLLDRPRDTIELHHFRGGYCGISPIEENKFCICYLATAPTLGSQANDIRRMEEAVLFRNPFLRAAWKQAVFLYEKPLTISGISFGKKEQVENHVLMLGDAAGMIAPLCGNGMSMALRSSKMAADLLSSFLEGEMPQAVLEKTYRQQWKTAFGRRLKAGRLIQHVFGMDAAANLLVPVLKRFPLMVNRIVRQTHGRSF